MSYYELAMRIGRADRRRGIDLAIARTSALPGYAAGYAAGYAEGHRQQAMADQWAKHEARGREHARQEGRLR